ncbi:MAG: TRAP transporter substrate-binding protein [Deltaproteobacteria bacterium]|jgi:tripartite ATP-independent transporter DctP family solute receptor|nr:TRAP transporter substrate-binding protein [Deltaproteobacteria bacterium]
MPKLLLTLAMVLVLSLIFRPAQVEAQIEAQVEPQAEAQVEAEVEPQVETQVAPMGTDSPSSPTADAPLTFKAGHTLSPNHPYHLGMLRFAALVEERTGGQIVIEVFPDTELGSELDLIESLQMGKVDMTVISTAPLAAFSREFMVYDLPFIFPDAKTARLVLDGPIGQKSLESVQNISMIGLTFFENGFRHVTNSVRPVVAPGDAKGLRIRTMENRIHMASFEALGAVPTPMSFAELYGALKLSRTDGQENPIPIIYTSKFFEVQKYCSLTGHFYSPTPMFISLYAWEKLSDEQKLIFRQAADEAKDYQRELIDQQSAEYLAELENLGMEVTEVDKAVWLEAMEPVYKRFELDIGPEVIEAVKNEIKNLAEANQ